MNRLAEQVRSNKAITKMDLVGAEYFHKGTEIGTDLWSTDPELIELEKRFLVPRIHKTLLYYRRGSNAEMHVDAMPGRVSILYWPIFPDPKYYTPLFFWELDENKVPQQVGKAGDDGIPFVFNALRLHSVPHTQTPRINLQLSFYEPIEEIAQLIKENRFFK
jgi:hypothetical protein